MRVDLPIIGGAYEHRDLPISAQTLKNWYVEVNPTKDQISLQTTPGAKPWSVGDGSPYVPPPPPDTYGDYIQANIVPLYWVRGDRGIVNDGTVGILAPTTRGAGFVVERGVSQFNAGAGVGYGRITPSGGGPSFLTNDSNAWNIQISGISEAFSFRGEMLRVILEGAQPNVSPQVILDFGTIPGWTATWSITGVSGTHIPNGNPVRDCGASTRIDELPNATIDITLWGGDPADMNRTPYGGIIGSDYEQGSGGVGLNATMQLSITMQEGYDPIDSNNLQTQWDVFFGGHAGFNWFWSQPTFPLDSDYTFSFIHTWAGSFGSLTAGPVQIMFATNAMQIVYDSGVLKVTHEATETSLGAFDGYVVLVFTKHTPGDGLGDITAYADGVEQITVTDIPVPVTATTFEAIGNNVGGTASLNYFPVCNDFSEQLCVDRALDLSEVAQFYAARNI